MSDFLDATLQAPITPTADAVADAARVTLAEAARGVGELEEWLLMCGLR